MKTRFLVIDTSIFRSAGRTDNPESSCCRNFLEAVLTICHKVIFTPLISSEFKKHRSGFSSIWLSSMIGRKKFDYKKEEEVVNSELRLHINNIQLLDVVKEAIEKDIHLIEAALFSDKIIVSRDDSMRTILGNLVQDIKLLKTIIWINPVKETGEDIVQWLTKGAPHNRNKCLGN